MSTSQENTFDREKKKNVDFQKEDQSTIDHVDTARKCSNCGWKVSATADICENCGDWLLKGKCNFCYADVEEGQKFCTECGNPPNGIVCHTCGELSHFDFCPKCNIPLTESAGETIQALANSVEFQQLMNIQFDPTFKETDTTTPVDTGLEKLKNYISRLKDPKQVKKETFTLNDTGTNNIEENLKAIEQSKQNISKEEQERLIQKQQEKEALKLLDEIRRKTFSSNQEARKFFGALKIVLPSVVTKRTPLGWMCNAYNCLHSGGPQDCADPSLGGSWMFESNTETSFIETDI